MLNVYPMPWHPYKYVAKTVYKQFFPILSLLENPSAVPGDRVVTQRKLLYIEKLFACLLISSQRVKTQLTSRIAGLRMQDQSKHVKSLRNKICIPKPIFSICFKFYNGTHRMNVLVSVLIFIIPSQPNAS